MIFLNVAEVARVAGCHRNTVLNYERRGKIRSSRDRFGRRRFTVLDAARLKEEFQQKRVGRNNSVSVAVNRRLTILQEILFHLFPETDPYLRGLSETVSQAFEELRSRGEK